MKPRFALFVSGLPAGAIQASVRGTHPAGRFEQFAQSAAGAMELHSQCVCSDAAFRSEGCWAVTFQVHAADEIAVLIVQFREQTLEARTQYARLFGVRRGVGFVAGEGALAGVAPSVQVDDRPAENAVEPTHRIGFRRLMLCVHGFEQAILNSIARQFAVAQLRAGEAGEGVEIFQQNGCGIGHKRIVAVDAARLNAWRGVRFRHCLRLSR